MRADGQKPVMPDAGLDYLVDIFLEAGPTMPTGMGPAPLSHSEIWAFQVNSGARLTPWEAQTLRRLSLEWIAESKRAEDPNAAPPYFRLARARREDVDRRIDEALGI